MTTTPDPSWLATLNATLNGSAALALLTGWLLIRAGKRTAHRRAMLTAFILSGFFLVGYVTHHASVGSVRFAGPDWLRPVYYTVLVPHVLLAAALLPLALVTLWRAVKGLYPQHRSLARITFPIWLFVSVSGVAVYFMLYRMGG